MALVGRMSVRSWSAKSHAVGPVLGAEVGSPVGGFWSRLLVSPPRSPPTTPTVSATISNIVLPLRELPPVSAVSAHVQGPAQFSVLSHTPSASSASSASSPTPPSHSPVPCSILSSPTAQLLPRDAEAPRLVGVFPSHLYELPDAAILTFHQGESVQIADYPRRIFAQDAVVGLPVAVDGVVWNEMEVAAGAVGHVFSLTFKNSTVCRIETTVRDEVLERVAVVQSSYSPLLVAAGFAPASSLLIYEPPSAHLESMHTLRDALAADDELGYVPTSELVMTRAVDGLVLHTDRSHLGAAARRDWKATKRFLYDLSASTADCIDTYARSEIERTGARELRDQVTKWRAQVG